MKLLRCAPEAVQAPMGAAVDEEARRVAGRILLDLEREGEPALVRWCQQLGDGDGGPLWIEGRRLRGALERIPREVRGLLERTLGRIQDFARAQRAAVKDMEVAVSGGRAGHRFVPVERAGCYAPGGRYPLISSALMTAGTAAVAKVDCVVLASPRPADTMLAAAALCGAEGLLRAGGAQAIFALALGIGVPGPCAVVCGPGNRYVTAAKALIADRTAIDLLAGPSELAVLADGDEADPRTIALDLLAQAEHDPDARVVLLVLGSPEQAERVVRAVEAHLEQELASLPGAQVARGSLAKGRAVHCPDRETARAVLERLAPEHLELVGTRAEALAGELRHFGALFLGERSAEVLGDYGAGPNHVLPTGGSARWSAGLSVLSFLRLRPYLHMDREDPSGAGSLARGLAEDCAALARLEGLEAHARAAERRR